MSVISSEKKTQFIALSKLLWVVVFALMYAWGGMEHKEIRRYVGPIWLTLGMFVFSRNWKVFLQAPLLMITLSLGYGADETWIKILKRAMCGFLNGATAGVHFIDKSVRKDWGIGPLILHISMCTGVAILLGVWNPFHAREEELIIGFVIGFLPMFMARPAASS